MQTPIKFIELSLRNFMSYGNNVTTINLDFKEPTLIMGKNHDAVVDGQIDSNGSGKCVRGNTSIEIEITDPEIEQMFLKFLDNNGN